MMYHWELLLLGFLVPGDVVFLFDFFILGTLIVRNRTLVDHMK